MNSVIKVENRSLNYFKNKNLYVYEVLIYSKDPYTGYGLEIKYVFFIKDNETYLIPVSYDGILNEEFKNNQDEFFKNWIIETGLKGILELIVKYKDQDSDWHEISFYQVEPQANGGGKITGPTLTNLIRRQED